MPNIKHIANDVVFSVSASPVWVNGVWECGDQRFTDESGTEYVIHKDEQPPTVGPITFQLFWTVEERIGTDELVATDKAVANFKKLLDDPRTTEVVMALPSIQHQIRATLQALVGKGVIAEENVDVRMKEILAGVMK